MDYDKKKDCLPTETINKIKSILNDVGIDNLEEIFLTRIKENGCSKSLRLYMKEDYFCGTNGKGTTIEYARASAYAEFMERIQYPYIIKHTPPDSKKISKKQFLKNQIYKYFLKDADINNQKYINKTIDIASNYNKYKIGKCIETIPYYHVNKNRIVYLPPRLRWYTSISTGTSAGNTDYEALVEGFCEVFERYVHTQAILEEISFPDIPEEEYMKYESINKIITYIKSLGFEITVKDASLNGKFPVICTIISKNNGKSYFASFGSHPYLPVAIERCLTESFQGFDLSNINIVNFVFKTKGEKDNNIDSAKYDNSLHHKFTELNKAFFIKTPDYVYEPKNWTDVSNLSNEDFVKSIIRKLLNKNLDIFIRNVNFLDFPAFQIYIPKLISNFYYIDEKKGQNIRFNYDKCNTIIEDNLNYNPTMDELLDYFNYFFHMRMRVSPKQYKNIEIYYLILLIIAKNYEKALNIINSMLNNKNFFHKKILLCFFKDYIEEYSKNNKNNIVKNILKNKYGFKYTDKLINLLFTKNGYNNLIKIMKNKNHYENKCSKNTLIKKNKIIRNLIKIYRKNIPNQMNIKELLFD